MRSNWKHPSSSTPPSPRLFPHPPCMPLPHTCSSLSRSRPSAEPPARPVPQSAPPPNRTVIHQSQQTVSPSLPVCASPPANSSDSVCSRHSGLPSHRSRSLLAPPSTGKSSAETQSRFDKSPRNSSHPWNSFAVENSNALLAPRPCVPLPPGTRASGNRLRKPFHSYSAACSPTRRSSPAARTHPGCSTQSPYLSAPASN